MSLQEQFREYNKKSIYPFHMPGHKRNEKLLRSLLSAEPAPSREGVYAYDYTEVEGLDNLYTASGILKEGMEKAARLFGSDICWYLVNGSTCGLLTGVFSLIRPGETALIARNCHKAVYNALLLRGGKARYLMPSSDPITGIPGSIAPEEVQKALEQHKDIRAVVVTSPTFEGVVSDIASISKICHSHGIPLLVDEAHGPHMRFSPFFPKSAVSAGADIVIQSLHKTLPALTQTALLHMNLKSGLADPEAVRRCLAALQTSSPSYVFMESMDSCLSIVENHPELFAAYERLLKDFSEKMKPLKYLSVLCKGKDSIKRHPAFFDYDPGKIVILTNNAPINGRELETILLKEHKLQLEMSSLSYAVAMTSICDTREGFQRLADALLSVDASLSIKPPMPAQRKTIVPPSLFLPEAACSFTEAEALPGENLPFSRALGKIAKEFIIPYPPGIPVLAPGEIISEEVLAFLAAAKKAGLELHNRSGILGGTLYAAV